MSSTEQRGRFSRWRLFLVAWLILSALSAAWSISTPIAAAPDEPQHIIKAASVVRGEFIGLSDGSPDGQKVSVPAYVAYTPAQTCYAYNEQVTANCSAPLTGDQGTLVSARTSAGLYNPVYYLLVGWPTLIFHSDAGIYAMRIVSGILASAFLAVALMLISTWRRRLIPTLAFAVAATPMVFFMNGVVNPNSLETAATLAAFTGVLTIVTQKSDRLLVERAVLVTVSATFAVNARGLSPLWVALALLAPFLLSRWADIRALAERPVIRVAVGVIVLAAIAAVAWIEFAGVAGAGSGGQSTAFQSESGVGSSPLRGFEQILVGTFDYGQGMIGVFGWLDTAAPPAVFFVWSAFIGVLAFVALVWLRGRALLFTVITAAGLVLLPAIVQAAYITGGGIVWQGRYGLPLFVCAIVGWSAVLAERFPDAEARFPRRAAIGLVAIWGAGQAYSAAFALKRYSVGGFGPASPWTKVIRAPDWSPPGGTTLSLVIIAVTCAALAVLFYRVAASRPANDAASGAPGSAKETHVAA
jgi:hypothetical protein